MNVVSSVVTVFSFFCGCFLGELMSVSAAFCIENKQQFPGEISLLKARWELLNSINREELDLLMDICLPVCFSLSRFVALRHPLTRFNWTFDIPQVVAVDRARPARQSRVVDSQPGEEGVPGVFGGNRAPQY